MLSNRSSPDHFFQKDNLPFLAIEGVQGDSPSYQIPVKTEQEFVVPGDFQYSIPGFLFPHEPVVEICYNLLPAPAHRPGNSRSVF
jgi:hypothetical protein